MKQIDALTLTLWAECRGEPFVGQVAVACVIRNRLNDPRWPDTYEEVVMQPKQFSCWVNGRFDFEVDDSYVQLRYIAEGILSGLIPDITDGANHYINTYARPPEPKWARNISTISMWPSPLIGSHTFYKL